jgi:quinol monooxygenase YgiN
MSPCHVDPDAPRTCGEKGRLSMNRRRFVTMSTFLVFGHSVPLALGARARRPTNRESGTTMYGIIGKIVAVEGAREDLAAVLLAGIAGMPGCLSYVVAKDSEDPNALWVTEVWDNRERHEASLSLPTVQEAIAMGRPLIARFAERHITAPLGGQGLGER